MVLFTLTLCLVLHGPILSCQLQGFDPYTGVRVGEASHPGPGGRDAARRKKQEKIILSGLQELLAKIDGIDTEESDAEPSAVRGRSPTPRGPRPCPPAARSESPGWQVKGKGKREIRKGKGKAEGLKPRSPSPKAPLSPARTVSFAPLQKPEAQTGTAQEKSLFAQLKALIMECDVQGTDGLLSKVRTLVSSQLSNNAGPRPPNRVATAVPLPAATAPARQTTNEPNANLGKGKGKGYNTTHVVQVAICQKWWPGKVISATKAVQALDEGCAPDASLVVATWEQCRNLRVLAAAHKLDAKLAIVCSDL